MDIMGNARISETIWISCQNVYFPNSEQTADILLSYTRLQHCSETSPSSTLD